MWSKVNLSLLVADLTMPAVFVRALSAKLEKQEIVRGCCFLFFLFFFSFPFSFHIFLFHFHLLFIHSLVWPEHQSTTVHPLV